MILSHIMWDDMCYGVVGHKMFTPEAENGGYTVGWSVDGYDMLYAPDKTLRPACQAGRILKRKGFSASGHGPH